MSIKLQNEVTGDVIGEIVVFPQQFFSLTNEGRDQEAQAVVYEAELNVENISESFYLTIPTPDGGKFSMVLSLDVMRQLLLQAMT